MTIKQQLMTVLIFAKLNTKRFFRDKLALFFTILFPLIFLFVFGSITSKSGSLSFRVALINESDSAYSKTFSEQIKKGGVFKVDRIISSLPAAKEKLVRSQVDGIIILPKDFGSTKQGQSNPSGTAKLLYSQTSSGTGQALGATLVQVFNAENSKYASVQQPFTVVAEQQNNKSLKPFDYTFAGLLGFSIIGIGIFGPVNVFPELKKQGILRRLHTTPLKVWQFFISNMLAQAVIGVVSVAIQFIVATLVFHLHVAGNYFEIMLFTVFSIFMILGIGLAIGGWAKNERQAAPLSNIIVFPMLFLSGTFFPRFQMPHFLQNASTFLPLTPVIDGMRLLTTEGKHLIDLGPQLGLIAVWFVIIYAIAFRVFRWE